MEWNEQRRIVSVRWPESTARNGIEYRVSAQSFPFPEGDVIRVAEDSFGAWNDVGTSFLTFVGGPTGRYRASTTDRRNVVLYDATGLDLGVPAGSGVIALTRVNWDNQGYILDADILFNGRDFDFSVSPEPPRPGTIDLQDVLTHEIGHFLGLDHTPLEGVPAVRPSMNPYNMANAPGEGRTLEIDDRAGLSSLYPSPAALDRGTISGHVSHPNGEGAFGVHVVAYRADTEAFVVSAVSGAVGTSVGPNGDGEYRIPGLPPGEYTVGIEPVEGAITYDNFGGIFHQGLDIGFESEYYDNVTLPGLAHALRVTAGRVVEGISFVLGLVVPGHPEIRDPVLPANTPDADGPYRVEALISDDQGILSAEVQYQTDASPPVTVPMQHAGGNRYAAGIPGQDPGSGVEYRIYARDAAGNETVFPVLTASPLRFEVLELSGEPLAYVALRRSDAVSVIDLGRGAEVARIGVGHTPLSVLLTPDARYLFVANTGEGDNLDHRVTVVEVATHRVLASVDVGVSPLDLAASHDGRWVYATNSRGRSVSVIDAWSHREHRRIPVPTEGDGPYGVAVGASGDRLYVTDIDGDQVLVLDLGTGSLLTRIDVVASPRSLAISPDGKRLYVCGFDGGLSVIDADTNLRVADISTAPAEGSFRIVVSPDGQLAYVSDPAASRVTVVDLVGRSVTNNVRAHAQGRNTRGLTLSAGGETLFVTNQDSNHLLLFSTASMSLTRTLNIGDGPRGIAVLERPLEQSADLTDILRADFDGSGAIGFTDFLLFAAAFGLSEGDPAFQARFDLTSDGQVNFADFVAFASVYGREARQ